MGNVSFLTRIFYGLLAAALLPILIIGAGALSWSERVLTERAGSHLHSVAQLQHHRVQELVARHLERYALVASRTQLRLSLNAFVRTGEVSHQEKVRRIIGDTLAAVPALQRIAVLDPHGGVVASTNPDFGSAPVDVHDNRGSLSSGRPHFALYRSSDGTVRSRVTGALMLEGHVLGYLVVDMSSADIVGVVYDVPGPGKSGETLLVRRAANGDAVMLTPTRFDASAGLTRRLTPYDRMSPSIRALDGTVTSHEDTVDYRGVPVISATSLIHELGWGVVAKMDREEVMGTIRDAQMAVLVVVLIGCGIVAVIILGISRAFRNPMDALLDAANQIGRGNLSKRIALTGRSEFAELARAFNLMSDNLQSSREQVELEIERRGRLEERFRLIIESAPTAMILCDASGRIVLVNQVTERLFGYGREELMGQSVETLVPERFRGTHPRHRETYCAAPTPRAMGAGRALAGLRKDGSEVPIEIGLNPIKTDSGTMVLSAVIDLTERRRFESDLLEKNQRLQREFWLKTGQTELASRMHGEHGVDAVAERALSFLCEYLDARVGACYVVGSKGTLEFTAGHGLPDSAVPRSVRLGRGLAGQAARDRRLRLIEKFPENHLSIDTSFGSIEPAGLAVVPLVYRDRVLGVLELASMNRFTDRHEELLTLAAESVAIAIDVSLTAQRMEDLLDESQRKSHALEQANDYKSSFLANMSHELRTPLNSLLILAQALASNEGGRLSEDECKSAEIIESNGRNLLSLINDILDMSKIDAGKLHLECVPVNIRATLDEIADRFRPIAIQAGHQFQITVDDDVPVAIETDPQRLTQILTNLLSNASKFTSQGTISLRVSRSSDPDPAAKPCVLFSVADSGIGIDPARQHEIFDAFVQADVSRTRMHGGTGLGLSISRQLAELLGGEITLRSTPGKGSTFTLVLAAGNATSASTENPVKPALEETRVGALHEQTDKPSEVPMLREHVVLLDQDMRRAFAMAGRLADGGVAARIAPTPGRAITALDDMPRCDAILVCGPASACTAAVAEVRGSSTRAAGIPILMVGVESGTESLIEPGAPAPHHLLEPDFTVDALRRALADRPPARSSAA